MASEVKTTELTLHNGANGKAETQVFNSEADTYGSDTKTENFESNYGPVGAREIDNSNEKETIESNDGPVSVVEEPRRPLRSSGSLEKYKQKDLTPEIGTEFPSANLVEWINASNADELLRDLAIMISERGVVFFRSQSNLTNDLQKDLIHKLGVLTSKPVDSTLHIHPILNSECELGGSDPEVSTISSAQLKKYHSKSRFQKHKTQTGKLNWHSDIPYEPVPANYTLLRLTQLPETGGDTLWASGYEIYDRISPPYQKFLESLTAKFAPPGFNEFAKQAGFDLYDKPRGSPANVGSVIEAVHPVVRTNPVTGWKSVFPIGHHIDRINDVSEEESKALLEWFLRLLVENHDLQVRFKWEGENDVAIWDNRSFFHTATFDYEGYGERFGYRTVGIGEKPFYDPKSTSKSEALAARVGKGEVDV
ncbi:TauD/TfdA-like domain [Fusarium oxysporum f. sp. vasinfectum]|nr:TauD/TfdA-like domain [Fusarium oxysporum f. sp. vasinfectum]KAK2922807.1 TauD/TfdA-like domain [Fusarium oxysporum f. sp. vasinfectum]